MKMIPGLKSITARLPVSKAQVQKATAVEEQGTDSCPNARIVWQKSLMNAERPVQAKSSNLLLCKTIRVLPGRAATLCIPGNDQCDSGSPTRRCKQRDRRSTSGGWAPPPSLRTSGGQAKTTIRKPYGMRGAPGLSVPSLEAQAQRKSGVECFAWFKRCAWLCPLCRALAA
jgi:hypothetical protein